MAKKTSGEDIFKSLKGFCQKGARAVSPGNIPTGHFNLDFIIQYGQNPTKVDLNRIEGYDPKKTLGIPLGKLVEIFGEEGGGKSSLAYRIVGYAQKLGYETAWIDVEHSFQENLAYINGCDIDKLIYSNMVNHENPDEDYYAEDVIDAMIVMMEQGIKVIVLDSVANLIPKTLFEADTEKEFMGLLSRLLSKSLGKLVSYAEKYGVLLVFINQLREKIGVAFGDPRTSPGGHSLHHNASLRLRIDKRNAKDAEIYVPDPESGDDMLIGKYSKVSLIKNRFAKPYRESLDVPIYYEAYFPEIEEIVFDTGRQIKLISVWKGVFNWNGIKQEGRKEFINYVKENKLLDKLIEDVIKKAEEKELILPPEITLYELDLKAEGEQSGSMEEKDPILGSGEKKSSKGSKDNIKKARRGKSS
jgi:recombination protein RecA